MVDPRPDRGIPADKAIIEAHDGRTISLANTIDNRLTQMGTWFCDLDFSDRSRPDWVKKKAGQKLSDLGKLFPPHWRNGEMLLQRTRDCFTYRHTIAHTSAAFRFADDGSVVWERHSVKGSVTIDIPLLTIWESRLALVELCWRRLVYPGIPMMAKYGLDAKQVDLPSLVWPDLDGMNALDKKERKELFEWVFEQAESGADLQKWIRQRPYSNY